MHDSLKQRLIEYLKTNGSMSFQQMESICKFMEKKTSNGEKRLRDLRAPILFNKPNPDYDPNIGVIKNDKGAIISYYYQTGDVAPNKEIRQYVEKRISASPVWWKDPSIDPRLKEVKQQRLI